ncbi:MAG: hypothetical protein D5S00_09015 [Tindallia sp. MSAO_Bac2]|nr:MAG: hypothetical protein D5S00_09015 [Tindallia sp. MSAO_Bac2]
MNAKYIKNENGFALPLVLLIFIITFILATSILIFSHSRTRQEVDFGKDLQAIHFAEAGLHYFLEYLNNYDSDNPLDQIQQIRGFDGMTGDGDIRGIIVDADNEDENVGHYILRLEENGNRYTVTSTAWPGNEVPEGPSPSIRTIKATVSKKGFTDFLYFFNEPYTLTDVGNGNTIIDGPYHSNRTLDIVGAPIFNSPVTYAEGEFVIENSEADFTESGPPRRVEKISFPSLSVLEELRSVAFSDTFYDDLISLEDIPFVFTDDTRLFFWGSYVDISQKGEVNESENGDDNGSDNGDDNGTENGDDNGDNDNDDENDTGSGWLIWEMKNLPDQGVIYVDGDAYISGQTDKGVTIVATGNIYIVPVNPIDVDPPLDEKDLISWIGSADIDNKEMMGLIAGGGIRIMTEWHDGETIIMPPDGMEIQAVIFSFTQGFRNDGVLTFEGSIIQKQNELKMVDGQGFTNKYSHSSADTIPPPFFIEPANASYEIIRWKEIDFHLGF